MTFVEAIQNGFRKYATFEGRASRPEFWWWILFVIIARIVAGVLGNVVSGLVGLARLVPNIAVTARRLHDIGRSGWWQLIGLIPLVGLIIMIYWCVQPPKEPNRFSGAQAAA